MKRTMDINCDMGEGFGSYNHGEEAALLPWVSSANIACGFHAGDALIMRRTVRLCLEHKVRVGAHPGLPDLQGFGRRAMALSTDEVYAIVLYQVGALQAIARAEGGRVEHVKPHGALYHMAEENRAAAERIAEAVAKGAPGAALVGLSGGELVAAGSALGLPVRHEAFADRGYQRDGALIPRSGRGAMIEEVQRAVEQALDLAKEGCVRFDNGDVLPLRVDTICIHGDGPHALPFSKAIFEAFMKAGIQIGESLVK